jgi:hypothetical protein
MIEYTLGDRMVFLNPLSFPYGRHGTVVERANPGGPPSQDAAVNLFELKMEEEA